ncbi:DegT/DnrJ/EryC1/StrS family aminotransferase [Aquisalimonas asiatica]|uniref:dTDP-4-amino-4,6-dideoxygalactose transaminase n=1 Tax=Aquisalimonas asiatica TaxID=406100 RepID=A0A1H8QIX1_9GAMM|nr:DegT/DnrJ/EryC1/StrS family aminotransferase [Aquisalimonas asiatica]SEO54195.1 dTDP-4-amino-4,6-dideoxygalactose transaminase [Aquisalimonas asiatica]
MIPMVDLKAQYDDLREELEQGFSEVLDNAQFILGPNVQALEEEVAAYLGASHAVSCGSGTDALHLALAALGVGPGDEVITTPFTFIATAEAICYVGATPVFVDIEGDTFNIDLNQVEAAIGPKTRAIMPVHLFGQPVNMPELMELADRHGLLVVEDCAQSFGAPIDGRMTGTFGAAGAYSFFPSKNLGGYGDGGLVATNDAATAEELRVLRNHGSRERYHHNIIGYNSRLDEIQAMILRAKMRRIDRYNACRRRVAQSYREQLSGVPGVTIPHDAGYGRHVYHQYTLLVHERDRIMAALRSANIGCAVYYPVPLHRQPVFRDAYADVSLPMAEKVSEYCMSLPIYPELSDRDIHRIAETVRHAVDA